jgi:hypothetical protein
MVSLYTTEEVGAAGDPFWCRADLQSQIARSSFHANLVPDCYIVKVIEATYEDPFDL